MRTNILWIFFILFLCLPSWVVGWSLILNEEDEVFGGGHYEGWKIEALELDTLATIQYTTFRNAEIDYVCLWGTCKNCDFTDTWFGEGEMCLPQELLVTTRNFKEKKFPLMLFSTSLKDLDLTDFEFSNGNFSTLDVSGSNMTNVSFLNCLSLPQMTEEQWRQTKPGRSGNYTNVISEQGKWNRKDFSRTVWESRQHDDSQTSFSVLEFDTDSDLTDAVFIDCDLSESQNLTLEQVKSTWNYKNDRMSLSKWPDAILKELEKEKEKAKEGEK